MSSGIITQYKRTPVPKKENCAASGDSVAKALLFEVDGFYGYYLKNLDRWLSDFAIAASLNSPRKPESES